ncbi:PKD/REJ-like protein [Pavlovales sp. CCMP2436]|nr:PKD/REJ-like protein [Pavlovales sp. CCMP2436]
MNRAPYGGQLKVTPTTGTATFTQFTLEGGGWLDEASDLPLEYAWFYAYASAPELSAPLSDRLRADTMTAFFPAGSLSVSVAVYDSFGARTTVSQAVTVSEPDPLTEAQIAAILDLVHTKMHT